MKLALRFVANSAAVFLALYLADSLLEGRFLLTGGVWVALILALVLGLLNSLVRPLHRLRTKPVNAITTAVLTVLVNALVLQTMVWIGAITTTGFLWVLAAAALVSLVTGAINWLIGFGAVEKARPERLWTQERYRTHTRKKGTSRPRRPI